MDATEDPECRDGTDEGSTDRGNEDSSLSRTGKIFGGLVADVRRKVPWFLSDFKDGLHFQCLGSVFLMYLGCLTTLTMFGGLLETVTENNIATMRCLVGGAICGVTYHLFCGQPLTILSSTGAILIFEGIVYRACEWFGWYYLEFRFLIGVWISVTFLVCVAFDLSCLMRYVTRFTQECFVTLLASFLIYETFAKQIQQLKFLRRSRALGANCACQLPTAFEDVHDGVTENVFAVITEG